MNAVVSELPAPVARRGITEAAWRTAMNNLYPGAKAESVVMVFDYCAARKLDPLKKPCHIVPMRVKDQLSGDYIWRDVVMPGIYEYRTTANRTGEYMGHTPPTYGDEIEAFGVKAPLWCSLTVKRWNAAAKQIAEFPVTIFFAEVVALKNGVANDRWTRAPRQMLTKCTEAAALREGFPDELGGEPTAEEMEGQQETEATAPQRFDPRPDTSQVDFELRDRWIGQITDVLAQDKDEFGIAADMRAIDAELSKFDALYCTVFDELAKRKIISKAKYREWLKVGLTHG